jgi:hypothetical protein
MQPLIDMHLLYLQINVVCKYLAPKIIFYTVSYTPVQNESVNLDHQSQFSG